MDWSSSATYVLSFAPVNRAADGPMDGGLEATAGTSALPPPSCLARGTAANGGASEAASPASSLRPGRADDA